MSVMSWDEFSVDEPISLGREPKDLPRLKRPDLELDQITGYRIYRNIFSICEQMDATVKACAYSPIVAIGKDYSCAVFTPDARLIAQAANNAVHLASMHFAVEASVREVGVENLKPGDVIAVNDPYRGGSHLPDLTVTRPVFYKDKLVMLAASRTHHGDTGGATPGSFPISDSNFAEGLRIPPVKWYDAGKLNEDLSKLILNNVRVPTEYWGDFEAQVAAAKVAERRILALINRYGVDAVIVSVMDYMDYTERGLRAELSQIPDGSYTAEDFIDGDGINTQKYRIQVKVTIDGDNAYCDFSGTDPQAEGPINAVFGVTASSVVNAFLHVTDPELMPNHGFYRPLHVKAPQGTIVNPRFPAPVVMGNIDTAMRIVEVIWQALVPIIPERIVGCPTGVGNNMHGGGFDPRSKKAEPYVWNFWPQGGYGGRATKDGWHATIGEVGNDLDFPAEVWEFRYPWLIEKYSLSNGSCGHGKYRGGCGTTWRLKAIGHNSVVGVTGDRARTPAWGVFGGWPGSTLKFLVHRKDGTTEEPAPETVKASGIKISDGDSVESIVHGAGGYGPPFERDPEAVRRDVQDEIFEFEIAAKVYGVVLDPESLEIDMDATKALRERIKSSYSARYEKDPVIVREPTYGDATKLAGGAGGKRREGQS